MKDLCQTGVGEHIEKLIEDIAERVLNISIKIDRTEAKVEDVHSKILDCCCSTAGPEALIISGGGDGGGSSSFGNTVEVFVPSTGQHCPLPDLPVEGRGHHTMHKMTVCGGRGSDNTNQVIRTSCLTLTDGAWETTTTLIEKRCLMSPVSNVSPIQIINEIKLFVNTCYYQGSSLQLGLTIRRHPTRRYFQS